MYEIRIRKSAVSGAPILASPFPNSPLTALSFQKKTYSSFLILGLGLVIVELQQWAEGP